VSPAQPTLADELAACRRTARDCQLVLALIGGVPLAPYEAAEAQDKLAALAKEALRPPPAFTRL